MTLHRFVPTHYHNIIGSLPPVLHIADGDSVITTTVDASGHDAENLRRSPGPNPMTGPFFVEGAEPGDALIVSIDRMTPTRNTGWTRSVVAQNVVDPTAVAELPPSKVVTWTIDREALTVSLAEPVKGLEDFVLPLSPMLGCFGVAPSFGQAIWTATSGEYGGNMDYRGFGPGTTVRLPVAAPGALFFLGDGHAVQGDGEIVGTGIETTFEVQFTVKIEKNSKVIWPRGETATDIFTVGNARPMDQALQHATTEMLRWLSEDYGLDATAASHLLGQVVHYDVGNVFDPAYTMVCRVEKKWLKRR